nr:general stress protein [Tissierella sp.]
MLESKVELFDNEVEVAKRIDDLKREGYEEEDMYIIVDDDEEISMLKGYTGVMIKEDDDSIFDRFKSFLKGSDSIVDAFNKMDLNEEYRDACYEEVQSGRILLLVNDNYKSKFELTEEGIPVPLKDTEPTVPGTTLDRDMKLDSSKVDSSVSDFSDDMRQDLGFEINEKRSNTDTLISEQIADNDITNR